MPESPSSPLDQWIAAADRALRTLAAAPVASRPSPAGGVNESKPLTDDEAREAVALMRVNHVGEVCAQALYDAQALAARSPELTAMFEQAAREEADHLAWTEERIRELGGRTSLLNPLWYGGAFAIGLAAARIGDRASLGFMAETRAPGRAAPAGTSRAASGKRRRFARDRGPDEGRRGAARRRGHGARRSGTAFARPDGDAPGRSRHDAHRPLPLAGVPLPTLSPRRSRRCA